MSPASRWPGVAVSEGVAEGSLYLADATTVPAVSPDDIRAAFGRVASRHTALADRLRGEGRAGEADIVAVGALIAADPAFVGPAVAAVRDAAGAVAAVQGAAEAQAAQLEALPVPELAERAGDIRQIARAVLDELGAGPPAPPEGGTFILARLEVAAYDLIALAETGLVGAVSVAGGASSHAAIVARGLGLPMLTGVDARALAVPPGSPAIVDADAGELVIGPGPEDLAATRARAAPPGRAASPGGGVPPGRAASPGGAAPPDRDLGPARHPREISVLCNAASAAETRRGLADGAVGVGLLRTEIPFAGARAWPSRDEHAARLAPVLGLLAGRPAVVRLLDFSGDKIPPFLTGGASGLTALLDHPTALSDQLAAVLDAGRGAELAILVPMVRQVGEVETVAAALAEAAAAAGTGMPKLGMMVEVASTAATAAAFAPHVAFFSIGTNDLTSDALGIGRQDPRAGPALAADPRVLALVAGVVRAARAAGVTASVCGEAAADRAIIPLLAGLGVDALSVPAARVARVRDQVAGLDRRACAMLADGALRASTIAEVWELVGAG